MGNEVNEYLEKIKPKMKKFFQQFEKQEVDTPTKAINVFKEIFKEDYLENKVENYISHYIINTEKIYIKNGYGLGLEKSSQHRISERDRAAYYGETLSICSPLARNNIKLFDENGKNMIPMCIDDIYKIKISTKRLLDINDDIIFKCLPINTRNSDEILTARYNKLRNLAQIRYSNDLEDELMSRYGGLDVNVYSEEYYLYNSLMRYVDDKEFFSKAVQLFYNDYPDYIETQIDYYDHVLYMIDHKDEYYKLANLYRLKAVVELQLKIY